MLTFNCKERVVRHVLPSANDGKNVQNSTRFRTTLDFDCSYLSLFYLSRWIKIYINISSTDQDITPNRVTSFNVAWTWESVLTHSLITVRPKH